MRNAIRKPEMLLKIGANCITLPVNCATKK